MARLLNVSCRRVVLACLFVAAASVTAIADDAKPVQDRWAASMRAFDKQDQEQPFEHGQIVFVGSSSVAFWDLKTSFPDLKVLNRGFGGSHLSENVRHFDTTVARHAPRLVVLYAGENDITGGASAEDVFHSFQEFNSLMKEKVPDARLIFISMKPSPARWHLRETFLAGNELIRKACEQDPQTLYFDGEAVLLSDEGKPIPGLYRDGLHLNDEGYERWVKLLRPHLEPASETSVEAPAEAGAR